MKLSYRPKSLGAQGIAHALLPLVVILLVAIAGTYYLVASHADNVNPAYSKTTIEVKFKENAAVRVSENGEFSSADQVAVQKVNKIAGKARTQNLFNDSVSSLKQRKARAEQESRRPQADLSGYYSLTFSDDVDTRSISAQLKESGVVAEAYPAPMPAPAPSADFSYQQNYLRSAPYGVDADFSNAIQGGTGQNVQIFDIEYSWNTDHEDLSKTIGGRIANGVPVDPFNDTNHGTAVLGELVADWNRSGINGAVPGSTIHMVNAKNTTGYQPANAIMTAIGAARPGDVILIEQQAFGPNDGQYVPLEWIPSVYDAISLATASGINVVEAAGNGAQNLDDASLYRSPFPMGKPDSGAIVVGAGRNCPSDYLSLSHRIRLSFSNYGSRDNLAGPGECVTTTGYGGLYGTGTPSFPNDAYTSGFNGTSSASPVVTASAAAVSSALKAQTGASPSPAEVRNLLIATGTGEDSSNGHIGPLPNIKNALVSLDNTPPSMPVLKVAANSLTQLDLQWTPSTDNLQVAGYKLFRNDAQIADLSPYTKLSVFAYLDSNLTGNTLYTYKMVAYDDHGNQSPSSVIKVLTQKDSLAPTAPTLTGRIVSGRLAGTHQAALSWSGSTDNFAVTGYQLYRDGVLYATPTSTSFTDRSVAVGRSYIYKVRSRDKDGNFSFFSNQIKLTVTNTPTER